MTADLRRAVVDAALELERRGLNHNTAGNVSVRAGENVLVTPTGIPADRVDNGDVVELTAAGVALPGQRCLPTSEWQLHCAVYAARPDVSAIVHTHSPEATAAACVGEPVPAVHYIVAKGGGRDVPVSPYATYGSSELAANVVATLGAERLTCLMANHGMIAAGRSLDAAIALAHEVEWLSRVHRLALLRGTPVIVPDDEIDRVAEKFRTHGQPPAD